MRTTHLLHELVVSSAESRPEATALTHRSSGASYGVLAESLQRFAGGLLDVGLARAARVGIYLDKRPEFVAAVLGTSAAGGAFVPINPLLKPEQVGHILRDCNVQVLVTSNERLLPLNSVLRACPDLRHVVAVGEDVTSKIDGVNFVTWSALQGSSPRPGYRVIDTDMAAIFYTSGSTGKPKGVVLSHRNMVAGATSVAQYLENHAGDTLLAALPLSFDAGFSQLTTAFHVGARVVLLNYLLPKDAMSAVVEERVTGLTAVPPLWIQLTQLQWPETVTDHLRYIANTGGRMPLETLRQLRAGLPKTKVFLMYGLTEAFRATYLPPEQVDQRPDSIGKAIPNAEILVLREDGTPCRPNEPGELVQRGALVGMGYWNDHEKTAERYKPLPDREPGLMLPEIAVFSGDTVRMDEEGFLYFIGRRDEMIKTSGYRVSPTEIEEVIYESQRVAECAAIGVLHPTLGQAIVVVAMPRDGQALDEQFLLANCRDRLPGYMVPVRIDVRPSPLPRNPNGKIDRKLLAGELRDLFMRAS